MQDVADLVATVDAGAVAVDVDGASVGAAAIEAPTVFTEPSARPHRIHENQSAASVCRGCC